MRGSLKAKMRVLWVLAVLVTPGCSFHIQGLSLPPDTLNRGTPPHDSAIFCDIESKVSPRHCATPEEQRQGIPLSMAAIALLRQQTSNIGLDYSPDAIAALGCAPDQPVAVTFSCPFPDGCHACLNCGEVLPAFYADVNAACVAFCEHAEPGQSPSPDDIAFCTAHARAATNAGTCFDGACRNGALLDSFVDPRRTPEAVVWQDQVGVMVSGPQSSTLTRTAAATGRFDAGADSVQTITHGDAWVDFLVGGTVSGGILGLSSGAGPDSDPSDADIDFGIWATASGQIVISERGLQTTHDDSGRPLPAFSAGQRLRITVEDLHDGTGLIAYSVIPAGCPGDCAAVPLRRISGAQYPFRVDASIASYGGTLSEVRLARIR